MVLWESGVRLSVRGSLEMSRWSVLWGKTERDARTMERWNSLETVYTRIDVS